MSHLRTIIASESALLCAGLARLLQDAGIEVVAHARDAAELTRRAHAHRVDIAIVALSEVPERGDLPMLMLAQTVDQDRALALLEGSPAGVGYLLEHRIPEVSRFISAVRQVAAGGTILDPAVVTEVLARRARENELTPRESEVLSLMAEGRSNRAIASTAYLSERAVERHVTSIFDKLRLPHTSRTHRRVLAVRHHLETRR